MKAARFSKAVILAVMTGSVALAGSGCVAAKGRTVYPGSHSGQMYRVELGTVLSVRSVVIDGTADTNVGLYGGGIMGGASAGQLGSGGGSAIAGAAGAVGGMIVGREIEKAVTRKEGLEIHIQLDNGDQIMVVQAADKAGFFDGDRVRVMIGDNNTQVLH